jgi:transposase InsO family protein
MGRDRLFAMARKHDLLIKPTKRYNQTTDSSGWMRQHPNLVKDLIITNPEQVFVADITYIGKPNQALYLHLITDAYSKKIMGFTVTDTLATTASIEALKMAISQKIWPSGKEKLIHHSDRGSQYCSKDYANELKINNVVSSTTQDGNPYDNAVAERANGILKREFGIEGAFDTVQEAQKAITKAIWLYNHLRPHLSNGYLTPAQMHQQNTLKIKTYERKPQPQLSLTNLPEQQTGSAEVQPASKKVGA